MGKLAGILYHPRVPEAQAFFNQAVARLHELDARAADHAFFRAAELDPQLLRQAICILAASPSDVRLAVQPLLDEATKGLFKGKKALGGAA